MQILEIENSLPLQQLSKSAHSNINHGDKSSDGDVTKEVKCYKAQFSHDSPQLKESCILKNVPSFKKKVRFADDCGQDLATIRVMTEPSDFPPPTDPVVIRQFRKWFNHFF